jgi:hypothetical protein
VGGSEGSYNCTLRVRVCSLFGWLRELCFEGTSAKGQETLEWCVVDWELETVATAGNCLLIRYHQFSRAYLGNSATGFHFGHVCCGIQICRARENEYGWHVFPTLVDSIQNQSSGSWFTVRPWTFYTTMPECFLPVMEFSVCWAKWGKEWQRRKRERCFGFDKLQAQHLINYFFMLRCHIDNFEHLFWKS